MDIGTLGFTSILVLFLGIMAVIGKERFSKDSEPVWVLLAFVGGLLGVLFFSSLNADGSITNAYAYSSSFQTSTTSIWPLGYLLLLFAILDWGIGIIITIGHVKF